jgi:hypothetical protein
MSRMPQPVRFADLLDQLVKGYLPGKNRPPAPARPGPAGRVLRAIARASSARWKLATRKVLYLGLRHVQHARRCERLLDFPTFKRPRQRHQPLHRQRQRPVDRKAFCGT